MREIRFRAKAINDGFYKGEWVHGYYLKSLCGGELVDVITDGANEIPIQVDTLGQYLGQKDCAGTEVYEGDIVEVTPLLPSVLKHDIIARVKYSDYQFLLIDRERKSYIMRQHLNDKLVVIGNIHDNKELIE